MFCNNCFEKDPIIYFDCYCIFCLDCYDKEIKLKYEKMANNKFEKGSQNCQFCGQNTQYKKCDRRNPNESNTIKQLEIKPELATLRAVESTKFNLIQKNKNIEFLNKKVTFMSRIIHFLIAKYKIINFEFPDEIQKEDNFNFIQKLHSQYNSFSFDNLIPVPVKTTGRMEIERQKNSEIDFQIPYQSKIENNIREPIIKGEKRSAIGGGLRDDWSQSNGTNHYQNMTTQQKPAYNYSTDRSSESANEQPFTKNIMGFKFQTIKQGNTGRDSSKKNSNRNNRNRLQSMIMQGSNLQTQFVNRAYPKNNF